MLEQSASEGFELALTKLTLEINECFSTIGVTFDRSGQLLTSESNWSGRFLVHSPGKYWKVAGVCFNCDGVEFVVHFKTFVTQDEGVEHSYPEYTKMDLRISKFLSVALIGSKDPYLIQKVEQRVYPNLDCDEPDEEE